MSQITVVGMVANPNGITLYLKDGTTQACDMAAWETQKIVEAIMPGLSKMQPVELDIGQFKKAALETVAHVVPGVKAGENGMTIQHRDREIPAKALERHIEDIAYFGKSAKGFKNFLRHFNKQDVKHSADELLDFMKNADMPIADDGSIIGYKMLNLYAGDVFVDCHTRTVKQKLGTLVYMPKSKVSDDRRQACGTGLHVAAPKYITSFGGSVLTLVKVRPHDVIRVPSDENTKMGCAAYQIVAVLDSELYTWAKQGKPLYQHEKGAELLANVVAGNHPPISTRTEVGSFGLDRPTNALIADQKFEEPVPVKVKTLRSDQRKPRKPNIDAVKRGAALSVKKIKDMIALALEKRPAKRTEAEKKAIDYDRRLQKAKRLLAKGKSLREVSAIVGIDRNKLSDNLKRGR